MNKTELIAAVAEEAKMTKKDAEKAVKAVLDVISNTLEQGEKVALIGFGTFEVRQRAQELDIILQIRKLFIFQLPKLQHSARASS